MPCLSVTFPNLIEIDEIGVFQLCLYLNTPILPLDSAQVSVFSGPNPAGNVGVHINRVSPVNKGEIVWTVGPEVVVMMGRLLRQGMVDFTRRIAVAGSEVENPAYLEVLKMFPWFLSLRSEEPLYPANHESYHQIYSF